MRTPLAAVVFVLAAYTAGPPRPPWDLPPGVPPPAVPDLAALAPARIESLTDRDALVDPRQGDPWQTRYE